MPFVRLCPVLASLLLNFFVALSSLFLLTCRCSNPGRASVINIDAAAEPEQTHILMRQSLCDLLTADFFPNLLSTNTLEEPTFKEIVVLYRTKEQADKAVRAALRILLGWGHHL